MDKFKDILIQDNILFPKKGGVVSYFLVRNPNDDHEEGLIILDEEEGYVTHNPVFYIVENQYHSTQKIIWDERLEFLGTDNIFCFDDIETKLLDWLDEADYLELDEYLQDIYSELFLYDQKETMTDEVMEMTEDEVKEMLTEEEVKQD